MKRRCVNLYRDTCRCTEDLAGRCIKDTVRCDIRLFPKNQIKLISSKIELRASVILQCIELMIMPVAVADLHRQLSVQL